MTTLVENLMNNQQSNIKSPFARLFLWIIFYGILLFFLVPLFVGSDVLDLFAFLTIFVFFFVIGFGIFNIIAPDKIIRYEYSKLIIMAICFVSTLITLEMLKRVDVETCRKDLQDIFDISFKKVEIDSCKADSSWSEVVLYAEIIGNPTFFNQLSNSYPFSHHQSKVDYPTDFNIHPKIMSNSFNLMYEEWEDYKGDGSHFVKIIGCHSKTFNCSFYYLSVDGTPF